MDNGLKMTHIKQKMKLVNGEPLHRPCEPLVCSPMFAQPSHVFFMESLVRTSIVTDKSLEVLLCGANNPQFWKFNPVSFMGKVICNQSPLSSNGKMTEAKGNDKQCFDDKGPKKSLLFTTLSATKTSTMSVDQNGVTSLNDFSTPTLSGTTDPTAVAPGRLPSTRSLMTDLKRDFFYKKSLNHLFCGPCTCDSNKCSQDCYFNYPYSCAAIDHRRDQIPILLNEKPEIIADSVYRPYEALHLVDSATKFFGRPYNEMNSEQQLALKYMCENREYLLEKLGSPDARVTFPVDRMRTLCTQLLSVFFLGAEIKIEFFWDFDVCEAMGWLGYTQTILRDDLVFERITMHPTQQTEVALRSLNRTESLALQRLSTLIHELIHAVLKSLCCRMCKTSNVNLADHGRAFQRLAMAIEERCPQLLGLTLDLGRINSIFADMTNQATGLNRPSMHDLEVYGFV